MIRHQLPVYSPLPFRALLQAFYGRLPNGENPLVVLSELLAEERKAERVILYGSGTQALQVALRMAVDLVGGEVALPAYSCFDVATAAVGAKVRVRFYDVDPGTLGPDLASLEAALGAGARVVVAGPLYGIPLDWAPVLEIVRRYEAILVEDAAQAHGCRNGGREAGMFGDLSILSFGRGKGWTGGAGGALLVREAALDIHSVSMVEAELGSRGDTVLLLKTLAQWALGRPLLYGLPSAVPWLGLGETRYREPTSTEPMARRAMVLALGTREASLGEVGQRRSTADSLLQALEAAGLIPHPVRTVTPAADTVAGYLRLPVLLPDGISGFPSVRRANALGFGQGYPSPLTELAPLRPFHEVVLPPCPGAALLVSGLVTLPTHSLVRGGDRERMAEEIERYDRAYREKG